MNNISNLIIFLYIHWYVMCIIYDVLNFKLISINRFSCEHIITTKADIIKSQDQ